VRVHTSTLDTTLTWRWRPPDKPVAKLVSHYFEGIGMRFACRPRPKHCDRKQFSVFDTTCMVVWVQLMGLTFPSGIAVLPFSLGFTSTGARVNLRLVCLVPIASQVSCERKGSSL
jgi:hypothetical protein